MKRLLTITISLVMSLVLLNLSGCGSPYNSSYSAFLLVSNETPKSSFMSFDTFKGRDVFNMSASEGEKLVYTASLDEGSVTVYYDNDGTKTELFTINGGETISNELLNLKGGKLYIIVESNDKVKGGRFNFDVE